MIIEINKDIEKYKENVAMGLNVRQLIFSLLSLGVGSCVIWLLYRKTGLTLACYLAAPVVTPIALCGFYSYNGMEFPEMLCLFLRSLFRNPELLCVPAEYEQEMEEFRRQQHKQKLKKQKPRKRKAVNKRKSNKVQDIQPATKGE